MVSAFMFSILRRNKTWLWGILIIVVIISFVIFFSPDVDLTNRSEGGTATVAYMDGKPVSYEEFQKAANEASIFYFLNYGQWPQENRGWDLETQAKQRLFLKDRAAKQGIIATPQAAAAWLRDLPIFADKNGNYSPEIYEKAIPFFEQQGLSRYMLEEFAKSEVAIKQLMATFGLPGAMFSPRVIKNSLEKEKEIFSTEIAIFYNTNFIDQVNVIETNLMRYYTNRMSLWRVPEKTQVNYVNFASTNYTEAAIKKFEEDSKTTLDEYINKIYSETDDPESFVDKEGNQLSEDEAKKEMRDALVKDRSLRLARNAARDFINLYFNKENITEEEFKNIATTNGLTVKLSEPFAVTDTPAELDITFSDVQRVFALSETNLYTPPIMGTNNVYAFFFSKKIEAYNPEYKNIQDKVLESYKESEAASKARLKARNFQQSLTNALANGEKTFEQLAQEANAKHITLPDFTSDATALDSEETIPLSIYQIKNNVSLLKAGQAGGMIPSTQAACVLYLKDRKPTAPDIIQQELPAYTKGLLAENLSSAFQEWFAVEYPKANIQTLTDIQKENEAANEAAAKAAAEQMRQATNNVSQPAPSDTATKGTSPTAAPAAPEPNTISTNK